MVPEQLEGILSFMKIVHSMNDDLDIRGFFYQLLENSYLIDCFDESGKDVAKL